MKRIVAEATAPLIAGISALKSQVSEFEAKITEANEVAKSAVMATTRKAVPYGSFTAPKTDESKTDKSFHASILSKI